MPLRELISLVLDELRGAWRFRWWALATAWIACLIGWPLVMTIPNTYEASARVYVDTRSILRPLLQGLAIDPDVASGLDLVRTALLSRPQIEQVARETDLDLRAHTPEQREALIRSVQERITIDAGDLRARTTRGDGLYVIRFQDRDRDKTIEVVDTLLNAFVENALGEKRVGQETAERFLGEQIKEYEQRLSEAEARLAEFKKVNVGVMPDSRGDYFQRLQEESTEAERVRTALAVAESRRNEIQRQLSGEEPFLFGFDTGAAPAGAGSAAGDITYRIQDLEKQLDELLLRFTDKHPEVVETRRTIGELKARQAEELARVRSGGAATGSLTQSLKTNPIYQSLEIELKRTEVQVAELRQELAQRQGKVAQLRRLVDSVPEVEAELARLNRDYEVTRQKYLELVQRREVAVISEQADRTGTVKFDVIDPPTAGLDPVAPNRLLLLAGVLVAALGLAGGVAYLLNHMRPVFHSVPALTAATGLPVLAAVSRTWVDRHREQRRSELVRFSGGTALLFAAFVLVILMQPLVTQLLLRFRG